MSPCIKDLYPKRADVGMVWSRFRFLHPEFLVFSHPDYLIHSYLFSQQIKNTFFSIHLPLEEVEHEFYQATNRGIHALNTLVERNVPDLADLLCSKEITSPSSLQRFIESAKDLIVNAERDRDPKTARLLAYKKMQALELGYRVLMIDTDREVQTSLRHYTPLVTWFGYLLSTLPEEKSEGNFQAWTTSAGVTLYGPVSRAFRSRVKYEFSTSV